MAFAFLENILDNNVFNAKDAQTRPSTSTPQHAMNESQVSQRGQQCWVEIHGPFSAAIVPSLQDSIRKMVESNVSDVVFDFSHCTMLDSSGIGLMIATCNVVAFYSGKVSVRHVSKDIARLLASMRLTERLGVQRDVEKS